MPKVIHAKTGKAKHFAYNRAGVQAARAYARATGGKFVMGSVKDTYRKKKT